MGVGGGREVGKRRKMQGDSGGSTLVGPGKIWDRRHEKKR